MPLRARGRARVAMAALWLAALGPVATAGAGVLVLKDGRALRYRGTAERRGALVVIELGDGTLASIREEQVDWPASERAGQLLAAEPGGAATAGRPRPGPRELEAVPERSLYESMIHTGRDGREAQARVAPEKPGAVPPIGPPRPRQHQVVDLLLDEDGTGAGDAGPRPKGGAEVVASLPGAKPPGPEPMGARGPLPLLVPGPGGGGRGDSPYVGDPAGAPAPEARGRLSPLVPPAVARGEAVPYEPDVQQIAHLLDAGPLVPASGVILLTPREGDPVVGRTVLEASPAPGPAPVAELEFLADGRTVGRLSAPPWRGEWHAPDDELEHTLEVVVRRKDGSRERARARVVSMLPNARVEVELVPLTVTVTNQRYLFVRDLKPSDFVVYEDGLVQEIAHFARKPVPLSVLVLADLSFSMDGRKLEMAVEGVRRLAERLGPEDRLGLAVFSESYQLLAPLSLNHAAAAEALAGARADGGTSMFDAELEGLRTLEPEGGRRVLIVLGDGEDYLSKARLERVVETAQRGNVAVYAVGLLTYRLEDGMPEHWAEKLKGAARPRYWTDGLRVRGLKFLRRQADETGGILYLPKFVGELPYVFEHLLSELKSTYSLGYYPRNQVRDGRFRRIQVFVDGAGLEARTRRGYYAPDDGRPDDGAAGARPGDRAAR